MSDNCPTTMLKHIEQVLKEARKQKDLGTMTGSTLMDHCLSYHKSIKDDYLKKVDDVIQETLNISLMNIAFEDE